MVALLDIEKIRRLVEMMVSNDLVEISLRDGEEEVNLRRPNPAMSDGRSLYSAHSEAQNLPGAPGLDPSDPSPKESSPASPASPEETTLVEIASPMVGTFYATPDPESPPFVTVGQKIQVGAVVCILEAMKVFNEIKSEVVGTIEKVLVKNAHPVEFGQPLFLVRPQ